MFSLTFLVCMQAGCFFYTPEQIFPSLEACEAGMQQTVSIQEERIKKGEIPPFNYVYKCVSWGEPA